MRIISKKLTSLLLALVLIFTVVVMIPTAASAYSIPSETEFEKKLQQLRKSYPHGGTYSGVYYEGGSAKAWTCYGYAVQLGFSVFGSSQYTLGGGWSRTGSMSGLSAGDIVRIRYDSHSVFITKITDKYIYYTDANFDGYNGIEWDQRWTYAELSSIFSYRWHIAGNNLRGGGHVHSYTTFAYYGEEHPHYRYMKCSCGAVKVDKTKCAYDADCPDCNHTVSFSVGNGTNAPANQKKKFLSDLKISSKIPEMDGCSFMGWTEDNNDTIEFLPGENYTEDEDIRLSAVWSSSLPTRITTDEKKTVGVGESATLKTAAVPDYSFPTYRFSSDDTRIATVDNNGNITGKAVGSTTVTVTSSNGRVARCNVTVELPAPEITKTENVKDGVKLTWNAVNGVPKYRVYVKVGDAWTKLADTADTTYLHTAVESNKTYIYTVRCLDENGNHLSRYKSYSHTFIATPTFSSAKVVCAGVELSWDPVDGAAKYRIQLKNGSSWKNLIDTAQTKFVHETADSGTAFTYAIRCLDANGKFVSGADHIDATFVAAPKISSFENTSDGVKIKWKASSGAKKYRVYQKAGNGWSALSVTSGTSTLHKTDVSGKKTCYTVCCVAEDEKTHTSGYNKNGWTNKFLSTPTPKAVKNTSTGVKFIFNRVNGAAKYRVFRKTGSTSWQKLGDVVASRDYIIDKTAKKGVTYSYTVRCISSNGKAYESAFDAVGLKIKCKK